MNYDTALLVIDVQAGMFAEADPVYQGEELLERINTLLAGARQANAPVIYVQHGSKRAGHPLEIGTSGWHIHPAIAPHEGDIVVQKAMPDAFYKTTLEQELRARGIKKLVITGIQSDFCVDTTTRRACSLDYDVTLVQDAHSTWDLKGLSAAQIIAHHNAVLGDWFATLKTTSEVTF
ncbi:MAG: cysteine hydrolase [Ktedonobacteraceae bacterium]|nr:cysteine hydrolase [Ktedonobacteraceae bacterium]